MTTNLNKVIEEWIDSKMKECSDCENERINGEGVCYGYTETANQALQDLHPHIPELEEKITKAFGGCTNCYGKGYATVKANYTGRNYFKEANPMKFCDCDRGKQLSELLTSKE